MNNSELYSKRIVFESCGVSRPEFCAIVIPFLFFVFGIAIFLSNSVYGHYPFPCSEQEKEKAKEIDRAEKKCDQEGVDVLIEFLGDENPRVRTAAFLSLIYLSASGFNMEIAVPVANQQKDTDNHRISAYLSAAAQLFLILQDTAFSDEQKQDKMIELSMAEDGAIRRMAVEGFRAVGDQKCLSALEKRINDSFGDHDDSFDMIAVSRVAFGVWWEIKGASLNPEQRISTIIASLEAAQPFSSRWGDAACDILEDMEYAAVPHLIEAYSGNPGNTKAWAARTLRKPELREKDRNQVRTIALGDLHSRDQNDRWMAVSLLGRFREKEDLDLYVELLKNHEDSRIRNFAVSSLGDLGGAKAIAALKGGLKDEQEHTRVLAARALAALGQKDGHALLLESFESLDLGVRNVSLGAIQYLDQDQVCARMLELVKAIREFDSSDKRQRSSFAYARADLIRYLDKMPVQKLEPAIPILKSLLKYPEDSIARGSAGLLKKLGVVLKWKYDVGQQRGWFEVTSTIGNKDAGKAPAATAKKKQVRLSSVARRAAEAELKDARQLLWKYWAVREGSPLGSPLVLAAFEKAVSAFRAVSDKYARTNIDSQALIGLFKLFQFAGDEKRSNEIVDAISAKFGLECVSDAYFELGLDYLQRAHDPRRALESFEKIPMPSAPDASDKTPEGMHEYEQARRTYVMVQQPMAKCEVQLGEPEKAERRYNKLIELFPELKESLQRSLVFEVKSIATRRPRRPRNKYSLSGLKQKLYQRSAARWLEDFENEKARIEEQRWGKKACGLRCFISIEPAEIRVGDTLAIDVEIKNISSNNITFYYQDLYQAQKLVIKNQKGTVVSSSQTAMYNFPNPKTFFREIKVGQSFKEQIKGRVALKFVRASEKQEITTKEALLIDFRDVAQHILQPGRFTAALRLTTDERIVKMGTNFGFSEIWTGELVSNEAEFSVRRMRRDELNRVIAQLRSGSEEQRAEAIEVIKANKDRQAIRELMAILVSGKGPLHKVSSALIQIQDISILPDLLDLYRVSARYSKNERGEHQRYILQTIHGLESDQHKMDTLFIKIVKSEDPIAARSYAASYLGMGDNPETVSALIEAANKEPVQVQRSAIDALGRIGSRLKVGDKHTIIEPLVEIMRTRTERTIRGRAVSALGQVGSDLVVPFLMEGLEDEDLFVGASAAHYLGRYAGPEAVAALEQYLSRAEKESQKRAASDAIKFIRQRASSKP